MKKITPILYLIFAAFFVFFNPVTLCPDINYTTIVNFITISALIVLFCRKCDIISSTRLSKAELFFALIFGLCMTLGHGLMRGYGFEVFYPSVLAVVFTVGAVVFYCRFSCDLVRFLYGKCEAWLSSPKKTSLCCSNRFLSYLFDKTDQNRWSFYFVVLAAAWLIPYIINFPGIVMFDTRNQADMYYHISNHHTNASVLLSEAQYITQHHSVPHTLLVGLLFDVGKALTGTFETGIFLYCLIQYFAVAIVLAYMFVCIGKYIGTKWRLGFLILFSVHPFFPISAMLMTKDIYFCCFFVLYVLKFYDFVRNPKLMSNFRFFVIFLLITLCMLILRNNAMYTLLIVSAVMFLCVRPKRFIVLYTALFMIINFCYTNLLLPAFDISPGSPREMLSIPFQQTAYYVSKYEDEVTHEEKEAIDAVIDYSILKSKYNPNLSDDIKDTYKKHATSDELSSYFKVWLSMLSKHPLSYVEAFVHQNYGYYCPGVKNTMNYHCINDMWAKKAMIKDGVAPLDDSKPHFLQYGYYGLQAGIYNAPFLFGIMDSGIYIWVWIFIILFVIRRFENKKQYILYYLPYFAYLIFILAGPANGTIYMRYIMPFIFTLPLIFMPLFESSSDGTKGGLES